MVISHIRIGSGLVLPAARFHAILRETHHDQTSLRSTEDGHVEISSDNSLFRVPTGTVDEFPLLEFNPPSPALRVERQTFLKMLQRVSIAAARDATRFQMHSVMIESNEGMLRLVSTDGKRLAMCEDRLLEKGSDPIAQGQYIVPLKAVDLVMKILAIEENDQIELHLDDAEITYNSDRISLSCRLVEGRFPDYARALPDSVGFIFDLPCGPLSIALRQASIMTTKETNSVQFAFSGDRLVLSAHSSNVGESRIELEVTPIETKKEEFTVSFNPNSLLDLIKATDVEALRGEFKDRRTAGLFTIPGDGSSYRHIVMPLVAGQ